MVYVSCKSHTQEDVSCLPAYNEIVFGRRPPQRTLVTDGKAFESTTRDTMHNAVVTIQFNANHNTGGIPRKYS